LGFFRSCVRRDHLDALLPELGIRQETFAPENLFSGD
jgi:hypothetical protein